nr:glycine cleavage system protein GcvH [Desulfobacterales bacterium]
MFILDELKYTEEHIWVRPDGEDMVTIGLTDYAQSELSEILYIELPNEGDDIIANEPFGSVESTKSEVVDLYAPLSGKVIDANVEVINDPTLVNNAPYTEGWLIRVKVYEKNELDSLLSADDYEEYLADFSE